MNRRLAGWTLALLLGGPGTGVAQYLPESRAVSTGVEARYYRFGQNLAVRSIGQVAVPIAAVFPLGRVTMDVGTWYAATTLTRVDGFRETVTGITDTQVRAAWVLGSDAVVLTALANLPTGANRLDVTEFAVIAATSSSFLAFPVNNYGSGLSLTLGAAGALNAGEWNLGLAGSARVSADHTPFVDADGPFSYQPGLEVRFRAGADRIVSGGRFSFGLTFSTFGNDEYLTGRGATGVYRPGKRLIGEASYTTLIGSTTVTGYAWDFFRVAGDSAGLDTGNRENLVAVGVIAQAPVNPDLSLEPAAEFRVSSPEEGSAIMLDLSLAARFRLSPRLTLIPVGRVDFGRLVEPDPGFGHAIRGGGLSVFLRWSL